ncbi:MAG: DUF2752 domain-containing protein [Planctomycetaceae bacterium]|nr:DUF2752 domain-containing protein [Planctomycetaceae bacterium]
MFVVVMLIVLSGGGNPSGNPYLPKCSFHVLTGLYCPGCGTTRAVCCLLKGQFLTAFRCQPLFIILFPIIFFLTGKRLYELIFNTVVKLPFELQFYRLILVLVLAFFLLRNIPVTFFDCLRPLF